MKRDFFCICYDKRNFEILTCFFSRYAYERFITKKFIKCKTIFDVPRDFLGFKLLMEDEILDLHRGLRKVDFDLDCNNKFASEQENIQNDLFF